jgi:hypothetical protein
MVAFVKKYDKSQQFTQNLLISIDEKIQSLEKGKRVDNGHSTETLNASSSVMSTSQLLYGMPSNYFAGQSSPPHSGPSKHGRTG